VEIGGEPEDKAGRDRERDKVRLSMCECGPKVYRIEIIFLALHDMPSKDETIS